MKVLRGELPEGSRIHAHPDGDRLAFSVTSGVEPVAATSGAATVG